MEKGFVLVLLVCMLLSGCGAEKNYESMDTAFSEDLYMESEVDLDMIKFDETINSIPVKDSYSTYKVSFTFERDTDPIVDYFFPDSVPEVRITNELDGIPVFEFSASDEKARLFLNGGNLIYFERNFELNIPDMEIDNPILTQNYRTDFSDLPVVEELEDFPVEDALRQSQEVMDFLGYSYVESPVACVGVNVETLDEMKQLPMASSYYMQSMGYLPEFGKNNEYYYILYQMQIDGNLLFTANYKSSLTRNMPSNYLPGSYAVFYIGRDGFYSIQADANFFPQPGSGSQPQKCIPLEKVKAIVIKYYENYILKDPITIKTIDFNYVILHDSKGELMASPAWIVYCDKSTDVSITGELLFIDAFTGELLHLK